jgi:hypothetical protein
MRRGTILGIIGWLAFAGLAWSGDASSPPVADAAGPPLAAPKEAAAEQEKPPDLKIVADLQKALDQNAQEIKALKDQYAQEMERQKKQTELQQKQIEVLERTARLLADQLKKQGPSTANVEALEAKTATLEARSQQAAQRDVELADRTALVAEQLDALKRNGPPLPSNLKELFSPFTNNETELSIYGQLLGTYTKFNGQNGNFGGSQLGPWLLLQLNKKFLLECNFDITPSGIEMPQLHLDWFVGHNVKIMAGRFLTPIGFFNERLGPEWINKLPDQPLMFNQVSPLTSTDGLQLRGANYLFGSPIKMEYTGYFGNGFQLAQKASNLTQVADFESIAGSPDEVSARAAGGRLGFWYPQCGLMMGASGYSNGIYSPGAQNHYNLWGLDFGWHYGNWDFRSEFAQVYQQADAFIQHNISRQGFYAQGAYRSYNATNKYLRNVELVARFGYAYFRGINEANLDMTQFGSPLDAPVNRNQYTLGINYYFYASNAIKFAYEINQELGVNFHDNVFLAQWVWAF